MQGAISRPTLDIFPISSEASARPWQFSTVRKPQNNLKVLGTMCLPTLAWDAEV